MAKVLLNPVAVRRTAQKLTKPKVQSMVNQTVTLSKRWPRAGNPAWTDSTGELNRHTRGMVTETASGFLGVISNDLSYAMVVHNGGGPRMIFARRAKSMKFAWKRFGGRLTYLRKVRHPATKGSYFLTQPMKIIAQREGFKTTSRIQP